ncbi:MAG: methionine--tRNA ligase [Patescibacteria group bacterium]
MSRTFYITTPIYYANASPHLGHAYADVIADVCARYHRLKGDDTFFLSGTDEHGAKILRSAEKAGVPVEKFVEERREEFKNLLQRLDASNDGFIYTADKEHHWPGAQKMWEKLMESGDLYKSSYKGLYCIGHEAFVTEKDLVDGKCTDHNQAPEVIEEENYFFRLSKYASRIKSAIESGAFQVLPEVRKNEVLAFLADGVEDISFSRPSKDIGWGIPVPRDPEHTMYVWADALSNYLSALGYGSSDESRMSTMWPANLHVVGKDILRFHAVIWPGMLMAANLPLPKALYVHGMIISGGQKMSKTIGNVINPLSIIDTYGVDAFRYFLMREIPFGGDGDFTLERFQDVYQGNLAHGLGNLVSRVFTMIQKYAPDGIAKPPADILATIPLKRQLRQEVSEKTVELDSETLHRYFHKEIEERYSHAMEVTELTEAIKILFSFFALLDGYIQDYEPYKLIKIDEQKALAVLWNLASHILASVPLLEPFMPSTAQKIKDIFVMHDEKVTIQGGVALFPSFDTVQS